MDATLLQSSPGLGDHSCSRRLRRPSTSSPPPLAKCAALLLLICCTYTSQVSATLDIVGQVYPDRLIESDSFVGTYAPMPKELTGPRPGTAKEIKLACLHTVTPEPFNKKMRCPDTAKMYEWFDHFNVYHRRTEHAPIPGVTKKMVKWFFSPTLTLLSPFVNCMGKKVMYWYKCWHPYDHVAIIPYPGLSAENPKLPGIFVRVWEHYRKLPNETVPEFELNMPMAVVDPNFNVQIKLPFVIPGHGPGIIIGAFTQYFEDTDKGLRVITEFMVGSDMPGISIPMNLLSDPVVRNQFYGLGDQVVRHNIEEFGNLEHILPNLYYQYHPVEAALTGSG